jgi:hypothetical protein
MLILTPNASPNTITAVAAALSNQTLMPRNLGPWSLDVKVFKATDSSRFLFQVSTWTPATARSSRLITSSGKSYVTGNAKRIAHLACIDGVEALDTIIQTKLQNQWTLRQTLTGENGMQYEVYCEGRKLVVRVVNVFLQGGFRKLVCAVEGAGVEEIALVESVLGVSEAQVYSGTLFEEVLVRSLGL